MSRVQFKEFVEEFKWLVTDRSRVVYEEHVNDTIEEVLDITGVDYVPYNTWSEEFDCTKWFITIQSYEDTSELLELANDLEYVLRFNALLTKSDYDISIICGLLKRYKIPHKSWSSLNFDNEPVWGVNIVEEGE